MLPSFSYSMYENTLKENHNFENVLYYITLIVLYEIIILK